MVALFYRLTVAASPDAIEPPQFLRLMCFAMKPNANLHAWVLNPEAGRYDFLVTTQKNRCLRSEAISRFDRKCSKLDPGMNRSAGGTGAEWA